MLQLILFSTLLITFTWYLWKKYSPYLLFQNHFFINWSVIVAVLRGKGPHNKPVGVYLFQLLEEICKKHFAEGKVAIWIPEPVLFIFGPDVVKFCRNEPSLINKVWPYEYFDLLDKDGIFRSNGQRWKRERKLLAPAFYPSMMEKYVTTINDHAQYFVHELGKLENQTAKDIGKILKKRSMKLFCEVAFGIKVGFEVEDRRIDIFIKAVTMVFDFVTYRIYTPWLHSDFTLNFISEGRKYKKIVKNLHCVAKKIMKEMKDLYDLRSRSNDHNQTDPSLHEECKKSFGDVLLEEQFKNPSFTTKDLETEIITLITAGYETGSYTLMWSLWMLGQHPDIQENAYEEVKSISNEVITYEDFRNLTYLECIIKETLRMYPAAPIFGRLSKKDLYFEKYKIPAGTKIVFFSYIGHRNPELYPEPEVFNPDRFLESESSTMPQNFIPFAESVRSCIGKNYAMLQMKVFLANIIRNFKIISLTPKEDVEVRWEIMLKSSIPLSVKFIPR